MIGFLFRWVLLLIATFAIVRGFNAWFVDTLGGEILGLAVISLGSASLRSVLRKVGGWNRRGLIVGSAATVLILGTACVNLLPNWEVHNIIDIVSAYILGVLTVIAVNAGIEDR